MFIPMWLLLVFFIILCMADEEHRERRQALEGDLEGDDDTFDYYHIPD